MNQYLQPIPIGVSLPLDNRHAVSVSFPTMQDVIGYEENHISVTGKMQSGYPRFFRNKLVEKLCNYVREKNSIPDTTEILPLMSSHSMSIINRKFAVSFSYIEDVESIFLLIEKDSQHLTAVKDFIRHSGLLYSSRKAEDILFSLGLILDKQQESICENSDGADVIQSILKKAYGVSEKDKVFLCCSGMNAIYSVFEAIMQLNGHSKKQTIVQAGWLYLDTFEIIRKYSNNCIVINSVTDISFLEETIHKNNETIGAVFIEMPNNPLLECVDLPRLYDLCKRYHIPLIVDSTIGTPFNMNIIPYCDIALESLTKFACGKGDVMMGAIIVNPQSEIAQEIKEIINSFAVYPYHRDIQRLSRSIEDYENRVIRISENTKQIIVYLEKSSAVSHLYSVLHPNSYNNFLKIRKHPDALPGLISVVFNKKLEYYYNKLNLPKGPSLGTEFTLTMPYVYLAHYDLVKTQVGREFLLKMGINPELLRISIGVEPVDEILSALRSAGI